MLKNDYMYIEDVKEYDRAKNQAQSTFQQLAKQQTKFNKIFELLIKAQKSTISILCPGGELLPSLLPLCDFLVELMPQIKQIKFVIVDISEEKKDNFARIFNDQKKLSSKIKTINIVYEYIVADINVLCRNKLNPLLGKTTGNKGFDIIFWEHPELAVLFANNPMGESVASTTPLLNSDNGIVVVANRNRWETNIMQSILKRMLPSKNTYCLDTNILKPFSYMYPKAYSGLTLWQPSKDSIQTNSSSNSIEKNVSNLKRHDILVTLQYGFVLLLLASRILGYTDQSQNISIMCSAILSFLSYFMHGYDGKDYALKATTFALQLAIMFASFTDEVDVAETLGEEYQSQSLTL